MARVLITRRAKKSLARLHPPDYPRVRDAIRLLGENPMPAGATKLSGREGRRLRVGPYRILYVFDPEADSVTVLDIGHRKDIYR